MAENTVAILGTGIMGSGMARNLLAAGIEVRAWNRSREKAEPLAENGATVVDTPTEATNGADFVLTMLADAGVTEEVVGGDGVLSSLADGGVWLQTATVGAEGNGRLTKMAEDRGLPYVDAPVLGARQPAEQGQLVVLASGPDDVRDKCGPVFDAIGAKTLWLGEAGAGSRLKLVVNNWIVGLLGTLAETISLARATGVDPVELSWRPSRAGRSACSLRPNKGAVDDRGRLPDELLHEAGPQRRRSRAGSRERRGPAPGVRRSGCRPLRPGNRSRVMEKRTWPRSSRRSSPTTVENWCRNTWNIPLIYFVRAIAEKRLAPNGDTYY